MFKRYSLALVAFLSLLIGFGSAHADQAATATEITTAVTAAMTSGAGIATVIVLGMFAIWAIRLLWKSK